MSIYIREKVTNDVCKIYLSSLKYRDIIMSLKDTNATLFNMLTDLEEEKRSSAKEDEDIESSASLEETQMADEKTSHLTVVNPLGNLFDTNATSVLGNTRTVLADPADIKENEKQNILKENSISKEHIAVPSDDELKEESLIQENNFFESVSSEESVDLSNEETCMSEKEDSDVVPLQNNKEQQKNITTNSILIENKDKLNKSTSFNENTSSLTLSEFMEHAEDSISQSQKLSDVSPIIKEVSLDAPLDSPAESSSSSLSDPLPNSPSSSSLELSSESPANSLPDSLPESSLNLSLSSPNSPSEPSVKSSADSSPDISIDDISKLSFDSFDSPSSGESSKIPEQSSIAPSVPSPKLSLVESSEPVKEPTTSRDEDDVSLSAGVILKRADQLKIAQKRIHELENTVFAVRQENAGLSSEIETLKKRIEELSSSLDSTERRNRTKMESMSDERNLLEESLFQKSREYNNLKLKIEELKNRLAKDLKSVRVREIELENRLELVKQEKATLLKSKDEVILNLKRKTEHLMMDIDGYRKKAQLSQVQISEDEERIQRSVRALRLALGMLEGSDSQ